MEFGYTKQLIDNNSVYSLSGRLIEKKQAEPLMEEINAAKNSNTILSLKDLTHMNSTGLNVIINIRTQLNQAGNTLTLCDVNDKIMKLLKLTKLDTILTIQPTIENAIATKIK